MRKVGSWLGIDRAIFFTLLARGWSVGAGLLTLVFVAHFLSPALQGYYYTFSSLIALQIFFDMGINFAIIQFVSHEMARLSWMPEGTVSGSSEVKRRLQSLMHFVFAWFGVAALLMVVVLLPCGIHFFDAASLEGTSVLSIGVSWSLLVVFTAANLFITAASAVLEGCGKVAQVSMLRFWQSVFSVSALWLVLSQGGCLYALAAHSFMMVLVGLSWLWVKYRLFFKDLLSHRTHLPGMNWRREIWPFQWRMAVSCMSGYLITQLFNPLLLATHGPVEAGKMGMSLQIVFAMNSVAMAWITTKAPTYGQLIATRQTKELNHLFARGLAKSFGVLLFGVISVWLVFFYLSTTASPYASRVLPLPLLTTLSIVCLANHISVAEAVYLRAHKQEPFLWISVLSGIATASLALFFVPSFGATGAVYSYAATALLIGLGGGTAVFFRKRREWAG